MSAANSNSDLGALFDGHIARATRGKEFRNPRLRDWANKKACRSRDSPWRVGGNGRLCSTLP
jgi:hypothetical protein